MLRSSFFYKLGRGLAGLLILLVIISMSFSTATAQSGQGGPGSWSQPVSLGKGWFPNVAVDATGRVHVVWASTMEVRDQGTPVPPTPIAYHGYDLVMHDSSADGIQWDPPNDISAIEQVQGSEASRPFIMVDPSGTMHMTYREVFLYYSQVPVGSASNAAAWAPPYPVNSQQVGYYSEIARGADGTLYIIFTQNYITPACMICYHLYFIKSTDNGQTWTLKQDISNLPTGSAKPQILVDKKGNINVVWEAGQGGAYGQLTDPTTVMYTSSSDQGAHWTRPVEFFLPNGTAKDITIGQDGQGNLVVSWLGMPENLIYYQVSSDEGKTWTAPKPIPNIIGEWDVYPSRLDDYSMATDSAGNIHLVVIGKRNAQEPTLDVLHLTWNGKTWSAPDVIAALTGNVPEWPRIAIGLGNQLNVVWFVRDQAHIFNSDNGDYYVWYSRGTASSPAVAPVAYPTPTPGITPSPTQPITTPTPTPVNPSIQKTPVENSVTSGLQNEQIRYVAIGEALVPAAIILLLVLVISRIRRL